MKKALYIFPALLLFLFSSPVFAQVSGDVSRPTPSSQGFIVATVNLINGKIISQDDRNFVISFNISNTNGAQSSIKYAVELTQTVGKREVAVDTHVYSEIFSLGQNSSVSRTIDYSVPSALPAGTYKLYIESQNESGLTLGTLYISQVQITSSPENAIAVNQSSCVLAVSGGTSTPPYISGDEILTATCSVTSTFSQDIAVTPQFVTRLGTPFGNIVATAGGSAGNITLHNGINTVSVILPKASEPQNYDLAFSLVSADGNMISNTADFPYVITGDKGTIQNVIFDKSFYQARETANLKIFATFSASLGTSTLTALVSDGSGVSCANPASMQVSAFSFTDLQIPITKNCTNPKASITLSATDANGNPVTLDTRDFQITSSGQEQLAMQSTNTFNTAIIALIIFIIIIALIAIFRKKKKNTIILNMILVAFFIGASFLTFTKNASADTWSGQTTWSGGCLTFNYSISYNNSVQPFQPITISVPASGLSMTNCNNSDMPFDMALTPVSITGPGSYNSSFSNYVVGFYGYSNGVIEANGSYALHDDNVNNNTSAASGWAWGGMGSAYGNPNTWTPAGNYNFPAPSTPGTYTLNFNEYSVDAAETSVYNCNGSSGYSVDGKYCSLPSNSSQSVQFTVVTPPTISASPNNISFGATSNISWTSSGYNYCSVTQTIGGNASPFVTGSPIVPAKYVYQLTGFNSPTGIAYDSLGNIFVVDTGNNAVYKFDSSDNRTTVSSNGQLNAPTGIAVDSSNNVYVTDSGNNRVIKFTLSGSTYTSSVFGQTNGMFAAVVGSGGTGAGNAVITSPNGIGWNAQATPIGDLYGVTYANGLFVAVSGAGGTGSGYSVATSPDGITWTKRSTPIGDLYGVTYANGLFVAVSGAGGTGSGYSVATSPDGITWTKRSTPIGDLYGVTYANGLFVAVSGAGGTGSGYSVATSPDGITWTKRSTPIGDLYGVTYANGLFVAVSGAGGTGSGYSVATSPDGITWTKRSTPIGDLYGVTYANGLFVAVSGAGGTGSGYSVATSPDGITWTKRSTPIGDLSGVAYGNGLFVAVEGSGGTNAGSYIITSPDGINWTLQNAPSGDLSAITYANVQISFPFNDPNGIAVDSQGNVYVADTGNNAVEKFNSSGNYLTGLTGYTIITTKGGLFGLGGSQSTSTYSFNSPTGLAIDSSNNIYVSDEYTSGSNNSGEVTKMNSSGSYIAQYQGLPNPSNYNGTGGWGGGPSFMDFAVDSSGNIYVDSSNNIYEINSALTSASARVGNLSGYAGISVNMHDALSGGEAVYIVDNFNRQIIKTDPSLNNSLYFSYTPQTGNPELSDSKPSGYLTTSGTYTYTLSCTDGSGNTVSTSTPLVVGVGKHNIYDLTPTPPAPTVFSNACSATIKLPTNTSGYLYNIYKNGGAVPINSVGLASGTEYLDNTLSASTAYSYQIQLVTTDLSGNIHESASSTASVPINTPASCIVQTQQPPTGNDTGNTTSGGSCLISQTNGPTNTGEVYVNKQVTFTNPAVSGLISPFTTVWSSTKNWNGANAAIGNIGTVIFTTVGSTTISALSTDGNGNTGSCSTTTTVILDQGTNQEI